MERAPLWARIISIGHLKFCAVVSTCAMLYSIRNTIAGLLFASAHLCTAMSPEATMAAVAEASGLSAFKQIESLEYSFHVALPDRTIVRSWTWWPQSDKVQLKSSSADSEPITYLRGEAMDPKIDSQFINDLYWLAFPFVVVWDDTVRLELIDLDAFTAGIEAAGGIRVVYPDGVGYTPGDVYELYYDSDFLVTHWVFRKGGSAQASKITAWKDYAEVGPLTLSLDRPEYPEGAFRVWFTDLGVTVLP